MAATILIEQNKKLTALWYRMFYNRKNEQKNVEIEEINVSVDLSEKKGQISIFVGLGGME